MSIDKIKNKKHCNYPIFDASFFSIQSIKRIKMKTIKTISTLLLLAIFAINASAFAFVSDKTEIRKVENFNAVKVATGINLYLKMGDSEEVKVVANDDAIEKIITEVKNGTLSIYIKKSGWGNWGFNKTRKVYVTVKELVALDASSGSDVRSENTLKGEELKVSASSGSDVELDIIYRNLSISASSGSDAKISGKTKYLTVDSSSGSDINAGNLESKICKATASSGSDILVNVSEELNASASSGADIRYRGNPVGKDINKSSGGSVRAK